MSCVLCLTVRVGTCVRPEFRNRSYAMELSRPFEPLTAAVTIARAGWRVALAQEHEARERGQAKNQGRLPAGEIGCGAHQLFDRLSTHVFGEFLHSLCRIPYKVGELRRAVVEVVGRRADGIGDVTRQVGAGRHLLIQEAFCPLIGVGRERRGGLLGLAAALLCDVSELTASPALARTPCSDPDRLDRGDSDAGVFVPEGC